MNNIAGLFIFFFCQISLAGQAQSFEQEWQFARYLADKEATDEAAFVLNRLATNRLNPSQRDSLAYLNGWLAYNTKSLDDAARELLSVHNSSPFWVKAQYFGAYCLAYQNQRDSAYAVMYRLPAPDSSFAELRAFQQAGVALLQRRYDRYEHHQRTFRYTSYALSAEEKHFDLYYQKLRTQKHRSPVIAGILSALLPGAGKVYAGKSKQGIAALLPILTLGLLTLEGLRKDGPKSIRFLGFGSLFTVFYAGNIWGSALAVYVQRDEFNRTYDNKILFDLHIPLRNLLN